MEKAEIAEIIVTADGKPIYSGESRLAALHAALQRHDLHKKEGRAEPSIKFHQRTVTHDTDYDTGDVASKVRVIEIENFI